MCRTSILYVCICVLNGTRAFVDNVQEEKDGVGVTEYTECWPYSLFDILLNKYYPTGQPGGR